MTTPSKEDIRKKYGISETDFQILERSSLPKPQELMTEGVTVKKVGFWNKFEVWLKTSIIGGIVLAVIFIGELKDGVEALHDFGTVIYSNREQIVQYVSHFSDFASEQAKGLLAYVSNQPTREDIQFQQWPIFPTGTQLFPVSGSWHIS